MVWFRGQIGEHQLAIDDVAIAPHRERRGNLGITDDGREFADEMEPGQTPGYSGPGVAIGLKVVNRRNSLRSDRN